MRKLLVVFLALLLPMWVGAGVKSWTFAIDRAGTLSTGLIAYYKVDESSANATLIDTIGTHTSAALNSDTVVTGIIGNARALIGESVCAYIPASPELSLSTGSISMWIQSIGGAQTNWGLFNHGGSNSNAHNQYYCSDYANTLSFGVGDGNATSVDVNAGAQQRLLFYSGAWVHIVFTWVANDSIKLWFAGALQLGNAVPIAFSPGAQDTSRVYLGFAYGMLSNGFDGRIDEIGIWNKELTIIEIQDLFNSYAGNSITVSESNGWPHTISGFNPGGVAGVPKANIVHIGGVQ